jgi:hypothetical protein
VPKFFTGSSFFWIISLGNCLSLPIRAADFAFLSFLFFRIDPDLLEKTDVRYPLSVSN